MIKPAAMEQIDVISRPYPHSHVIWLIILMFYDFSL